MFGDIRRRRVITSQPLEAESRRLDRRIDMTSMGELAAPAHRHVRTFLCRSEALSAARYLLVALVGVEGTQVAVSDGVLDASAERAGELG